MKTLNKVIVSGMLFLLCGITLVHAQNKKTIAVVDFKADSTAIKICDALSDVRRLQSETSLLTPDLVYTLVNDGKFDVMDRQRLKELMDEQSFGGDYTLLGKDFGADYILTGEIENLEMSQREHEFKSSGVKVKELYGHMMVHVRIIDVATSKVIVATKVEHKALERLNEYGKVSPVSFFNKLKESAARKIANQLVEAVTPLRITSVSGEYVYLNRGEGSSIEVGTELEVYRDSLQKGTSTAQSMYPIGELRVHKMLPKMAMAQIKRYKMPVQAGDLCEVKVEDQS